MGRHNLGRSSTTFVAPAFSSPVFQQQKTTKAWLVYAGLMDDQYSIQIPFRDISLQKFTLPETNMAPENNPLEKEIPIVFPSFLSAMLVSGSAHIPYTTIKQSRYITRN